MQDHYEIAAAFGRALDQDDYDAPLQLLHENCEYQIGEEILLGPKAIVDSYHQNMLEGRAKLDELVWGKCRIEAISATKYFVHFTDYLTHQNQKYTHRCKQLLDLNEAGKIIRITHVENKAEAEQLQNYYQKVGLAKKD